MIYKINRLIGKAYDKESFNCYHLVQELVPCVPDFDTVVSRLLQSRYLNQDVYTDMREVTVFKDGDIILLGAETKHLHHVGVFYQGLIVHADKPMVRAESLAHIQKAYPVMKGFRCIK